MPAIAALLLRCLLPYPDVARRIRLRRRAHKRINCEPWDDDNATGPQAAQLALLRLLWLQRRVHFAAWMRRSNECAVIGRLAAETYFTGMYLLHSGNAVSHFRSAANRAGERMLSYLAEDGVIPADALADALGSLGEQRPPTTIRQMVDWLATEKNLPIAKRIYSVYYEPISALFIHANAFTLTSHVRPGNTLSHRPAFAWSRRSAVRLTDGCTGLLAAAIADEQEEGAPFTTYAHAHLDRLLTPAVTSAGSRALAAGLIRRLPATLARLLALRSYIGRTRGHTPEAERRDHVRAEITAMLTPYTAGIDMASYEQILTYFADLALRSETASEPDTTDAS